MCLCDFSPQRCGHNEREIQNNKKLEGAWLLTWAMELTLDLERCENTKL